MEITLLTEAEIRRCVGMDLEAIAAVEDGFTRLANGEATMPPIVCLPIPEHRGEVDIKTAMCAVGTSSPSRSLPASSITTASVCPPEAA